MREVEVKAKVENLSELETKLVALGCTFSEPLHQDDHIYNKKGDSLGAQYRGMVVLRIRNQNGVYIVTLKQQQENEKDNIEREVVIDDSAAMNDILAIIGYEETMHVKKVRRSCAYQEMTICLDEVEGLGSFIEVEKLTEGEGGSIVQEELFLFLETLGVSRNQRVLEGYDTQLYNKQKKQL
ncbi:MAG: class IV adenylate cyclase [bacterium]|nr:class IV adenylate cyclase [bacterium]